MRLAIAVLVVVFGASRPTAACPDHDDQQARVQAQRDAEKARVKALREARRQVARAMRQAQRARDRAIQEAQRDRARQRAMPQPGQPLPFGPDPDVQQKLEKLQRKLDKLQRKLERFSVPKIDPSSNQPARAKFEIRPQADGDIFIEIDPY